MKKKISTKNAKMKITVVDCDHYFWVLSSIHARDLGSDCVRPGFLHDQAGSSRSTGDDGDGEEVGEGNDAEIDSEDELAMHRKIVIQAKTGLGDHNRYGRSIITIVFFL